jgi:hypothetical protein
MSDIKCVRYFNGEFLIEDDFNAEQEYHLGMRYRHNKDFHNWGIVNGLEVTFAAGEKFVTVNPGLAVDENGQEIVLDASEKVNFDQDAFTGRQNYYITIAWNRQESDFDENGKAKRWLEKPVFAEPQAAPNQPGVTLILARVALSTDKTICNIDNTQRKISTIEIRNNTVTEDKLDAATRGKLVTNGNSHDHTGGDGAQIMHSHLIKDDGRNPHGTTAADVGALPAAGGMVNGDLTVNGSMDVTGNVGIGTNEPSHKFHVKADGAVGLFESTSNNAYLRVSTSEGMDNRVEFCCRSGGRAAIWVAGSDAFNVLKNGNVGIGTTEPRLGKLHVISNEWLGAFESTTKSAYLFLGTTEGKAAFCMRDGARAAIWVSNLGKYGTDVLTVLQNGSVGIGTEDTGKNILAAMGRLYSSGGWATTAADYSEYFESETDTSIPVGTSVTLTEKGKIRPARKDDIPIGIITLKSAFIGNSYLEWPQKYLRDEFGNMIIEEYKEEITAPKKEKTKKERQKTEKKKIIEKTTRTEIVLKKGKYCREEIEETVEREQEEPVFKEVDLYDAAGKEKIGKHHVPVMESYEEEIDVLDENGQPVMIGTGKFETKTRPQINPQYDETRIYIPREERPEWNCVGLLGQLHLRKGQPTAENWIKMTDISKDVELWLVK